MRALQIVDAKIVRSDPEHPVASFWAGEVLEGPAAELQVALGHAYMLPEAAIAQEATPEAPAPGGIVGGPILSVVSEAGPEVIAEAKTSQAADEAPKGRH